MWHDGDFGCVDPSCGLFADGPFWDIHVQAKQGLFLRSVSFTGSVVGGGILQIDSPSVGFFGRPPGFAFFAPGTNEDTIFLSGGYFIGPAEPVAAYDVIVRFATVSAVPEPGIAALMAGAAVTMLTIRRRRA
jgi:hypothetical protein